MTYLSFADKLKILFGSFFDFKGILIFGILMIILTVLYFFKRLSIKRYTIGISLSLVLVFLISILTNIKVLSNTFDNFTTVFFTGIYFPSIYLYISTLVIVLGAFLFSIINVKLKRVYKIINKVMFVVNNIIFVMIINIVAKNKIDIFSINSLYTNTNLVGMLEISMSIFLIWIAALIVAYITNCICDRLALKQEEKVLDTVTEKVNNDYSKDYSLVERTFFGKKKKNTIGKEVTKPILEYVSNKIPESVCLVHNLVDYDVYTDYNTNNVVENKKEVFVPLVEIKEETTENKDRGITFNDILNGNIPVSYYDNEVNNDIEFKISNPQEVYEGHYNDVKLQDLVEESSKEEIVPINNITVTKEEVIPEKDNIIEKNNDIKENIIIEPSIEERTKEIKSKRAVDNLLVNTVSLNELVDDEVLEDVKIIDKARESSNGEVYTVEDYKKIIGMLNTLKEYSIDHNITIDDAVTISLINNYSIDDCLKFKDILESNLN